ncbi:MAG: hypothetical protein V1889_02915 [archaeon]
MAVLKDYDWCDERTFAEIKKKFSNDGVALSQEEIDELIRDKDLKLKQIVKKEFD